MPTRARAAAIERTGTPFAQDERKVAQLARRHALERAAGPVGTGDQHQFVFGEEVVEETVAVAEALDDTQVDGAPFERLLDLATVARQKGDAQVGIAGRETGENRRQEVLGDRRAGSEAQLAFEPFGAAAHLVLHAPVLGFEPLGAPQQHLARRRQFEAAAPTVEERHAVGRLERTDMLAHGRLRDEELLGGLRETERTGRRDEDAESEVVHRRRGVNPDRPARQIRAPSGCSGRWSPPS